MQKMVSRLAVLAVSWAIWLCPHAALPATPVDPNQVRIEDLQHRVDALYRELMQLERASDPAVQRRDMRHHWSMMQDYMRSVRGMPGMYAQGCTDWMMMDPAMTGPGMMGPGMMGHGMMGPGMMSPGAAGCPMMGHGMGSGGMWGLPSHMTPGLYQSQMQGYMQQMQHQMAAISRETDPARRDALLREHYQSMYCDMQSMRGMGWMWAPTAAATLPDPESQGARLVAAICSQCHAPPSPALHVQADWASVTARMRQHMQEQNSAAGGGVRVPSATELDEITQYLADHAAAARPQP